VPSENLRDYRRVRDNLACTGYECAVVQGKDDAKRAVAHRKALQVLVKKGKGIFGDMDVYCFKAEVQRRLDHDLPAVLSDFHFKEASNLLGCAVSALTEYMAACFVAYETEIHRLNAIIVRLKLDNKKLKKKMEDGECVSQATSEVSQGRSTTLGEWRAQTLREKSKAFVTAMRLESGNCDLKAITLAAEVLRRLEGPDNLSKGHLVNASIVESLKEFYTKVIPPVAPPNNSLSSCLLSLFISPLFLSIDENTAQRTVPKARQGCLVVPQFRARRFAGSIPPRRGDCRQWSRRKFVLRAQALGSVVGYRARQ
jgi:hypothetical protein